MKKMLILLVLAALLASTLVACGGGAAAPGGGQAAPPANEGQVFNFRFNHGGSEATLIHQATVHFAEQVYELSNGQIIVEIFPNAGLGPEATTLEALQMGDIEFTSVNSGALVSFAREWGIFATPFAFPDTATAHAVMDGPFGARMVAYLEPQGFTGLGFLESTAFRQTTSSRPIRQLEDLSGLRIRVLDNPIQIRIWESLGAAPTPIPFAELYTALQQGTVDAMENPIELITAMRFYEVQDYIILTDHAFQTSQLLMSSRVFNQLPADLQEAVREAGRRAVSYQRSRFDEVYPTLLNHLREQGVEIIELSAGERERFRQASEGALDFIREQVGSELVDNLLESIEAVR